MSIDLIQIQKKLKRVDPSVCLPILRGIEKETLRVDERGQVSRDVHPRRLGSALTHPHITTDFAESLLELVTDPHSSYETLAAQLQGLNQIVYQNLPPGQLLWPGSMPGLLEDLSSIPIAEYGSSHLGQMKHIYRRGLVNRYGKAMQMIAGLHYNVSFSSALFQGLVQREPSQGEISAYYMNLIRHFYAHYWILPYLFGASPVCMRTSLSQEGVPPCYLEPLDADTWISPYATSLRNSEIGYQNTAQSHLDIVYDSVETYSHSLFQATRMIDNRFAKIGVKRDGQYIQLSNAILQIENEYYNPIRPKQPVRTLERPSTALLERGIAYVEVRVLDLNPFESLGLSASGAHFMDVFLLFCLLEEREALSLQKCRSCRERFSEIVTRGRDPELQLEIEGQKVSLKTAALPLFEALLMCARWMDQGISTPAYEIAVLKEYQKIENVEQTPSAQVLNAVKKDGYVHFMLRLGRAYQMAARNTPLSPEFSQRMQQEALDSWIAQTLLEKETQGSFDDFLKAQGLL